jgi:hypothetical protein
MSLPKYTNILWQLGPAHYNCIYFYSKMLEKISNRQVYPELQIGAALRDASTPTPPAAAPPPPRCPPRSGALRSPPPPPRALRTRLHPVYLLLGSFFPGGPVPAGSAPASAGQRRASAPSGDLQADGRVSFVDVVRLGHLNSARGRPPPSYQPKRAITAPRSNCAE